MTASSSTEGVLAPGWTILALETSCDETAAAVVRDGRTIISNVVASQMDEHRRYGGIVPEVASRQHILSLSAVVEEAISTLPGGWSAINAVAATYGPGLSGALLTGLNAAKGIAWARDLPFVGVNHLEAHIYANWLLPDDGRQTIERRKGTTGASSSIVHRPSSPPEFPIIALIVSGGHTVLVLLKDHGKYEILGQTRDDAAGEAFDKVARILQLGYPGGPAVQQAAENGAGGSALPRAWLRDTYDFSFSGIKTAVLHKVQEHQAREAKVVSEPRGKRGTKYKNSSAKEPPAPIPSERFAAQLAYAFQESVVDVLATKTIDAARTFGAAEILLAGGVAANTRLRAEVARRSTLPVRYPPLALCTDNAAMVAAAAYYRFDAGLQSGWELDVQPNLRLRADA